MVQFKPVEQPRPALKSTLPLKPGHRWDWKCCKRHHHHLIPCVHASAVQGFQEGKIHFPPTFKFLPGTSQYSEQRVPSWTDRILWKVRPSEPWADSVAPTVEQAYYSSVPEMTSSDHKPVVAGFDLLLTAAELPSMEAGPHNTHSRCSIM